MGRQGDLREIEAYPSLEWTEDNRHLKEVKNPRLIETGSRSKQMKLWTLGPDEWLLFLKLPDYTARKKSRKASDVVQLPFFTLPEPGQQAI